MKALFRLRIACVAFIGMFLLSSVVSAVEYASTSVLARGKWKKLSVTESGIYKLDYSDIVSMGLNPAKVQIFGYGGKLLSEDFSLNDYKDDLPEVAVFKNVGSDSVFNAGDFLLFYARGPVTWSYNASNSMYLRTRNHYSNKAYYFIGERESGTLTTTVSTFSALPNRQVTSFTDFVLHEIDKVNFGETVASKGTGRELYGEDFLARPSQIFDIQVSNPDTTVNSKMFVDFAANNTSSTFCNVFADNIFKSAMYFGPISTIDDYTYGYPGSMNGVFKLKSSSLKLQLDYYFNATNSESRAYLNCIALNLRRFLVMAGSTMAFRDPNSVGLSNVARFDIRNAGSNLLVFDVTNPNSMVQMQGVQVDNVYSFVNSAATLREYVAVDASKSIPKPNVEGGVVNQNLHAAARMDMVMVVPPDFIAQARRLAEAHVKLDGLSSLIVTPEQVYNEFSSGTPDATAIRRMLKYYYDKGLAAGKKPRFLLLFGDGVYDNRQVSSAFSGKNSKKNTLLTFQSVESLSGFYSYVTDDYFGFLDSNEGSSLSLAKLDIGIGRFPVSTVEEARIAVDKTISYMENARKGAWKNRLLFLADNGDTYLHEKQANDLANSVSTTYPEFMIHKVFLDTFTPETTTSGMLVPDANRTFGELLDAGVLLLNYTGHGSTSQWAEEKLLLKQDILKMTNKHLPLWVTATCDFTRYDDKEKSGGEMVFLQEHGGGVALVTTSRIVYSDSNYTLNQALLDNVFAKKAGSRLTLGEIVNEAKCDDDLFGDANKLNFTLIGDPALKLGYPELSAQITEVNGVAVSAVIDTFKALSTVTLSGKVFRADGSLADDFSGLIVPTVLDAEQIIATYELNYGQFLSVADRSKVLFSGKDSVVNGIFNFSFVIPLDNSYSFKKGRINLYAWENSGINEAQGNYDGFVLGGTDMSVTLNEVGPNIQLYLNDASFANGGSVGVSPTLIAQINDENGLNTSGNGIGHDLTLTIDGKSTQTYNVNPYYSANVGSYSSGTVLFQLPILSPGRHELSFKAWDVHNNSAIQHLSFFVRTDNNPEIGRIVFAQQGNLGRFRFSHDRPVANVRIRLSVVDLLGRVVWETNRTMQAESNLSDVIDWDLCDAHQRRVANGVYICRIQLKDSNGAETVDAKKISITEQ